jgi:hypothetical protein
MLRSSGVDEGSDIVMMMMMVDEESDVICDRQGR